MPSNAAPATTSAADRQPMFTASHASAGRKISWPVAPAAVSAPRTRPRRCTNQRLATIAARTVAIDPVPTPTTTPQSKSSCHGWCMKIVRPDPAETVSSAPTTTLRTPKRSIKPPANGAKRPKSIRLMETAIEIVARDQPNSCWSGTIRTAGVDRKPAAASSVNHVTAATTQA